jgi:hypothetical protein
MSCMHIGVTGKRDPRAAEALMYVLREVQAPGQTKEAEDNNHPHPRRSQQIERGRRESVLYAKATLIFAPLAHQSTAKTCTGRGKEYREGGGSHV